jgi:hypothetical protein
LSLWCRPALQSLIRFSCSTLCSIFAAVAASETNELTGFRSVIAGKREKLLQLHAVVADEAEEGAVSSGQCISRFY